MWFQEFEVGTTYEHRPSRLTLHHGDDVLGLGKALGARKPRWGLDLDDYLCVNRLYVACAFGLASMMRRTPTALTSARSAR